MGHEEKSAGKIGSLNLFTPKFVGNTNRSESGVLESQTHAGQKLFGEHLKLGFGECIFTIKGSCKLSNFGPNFIAEFSSFRNYFEMRSTRFSGFLFCLFNIGLN